MDALFELYNMRKIFGAYRFHFFYDRLAGGFRNPDLGASLDHEVLLSFYQGNYQKFEAGKYIEI